MSLRNELNVVKKGTDPIDVYFQKIKQIRDKLAALLVVLDDEELLHVALDGLPSEYDSFSSTIRTCSDVLIVEELNTLLNSKERTIRKRSSVFDTTTMAMAANYQPPRLVEVEAGTILREVVLMEEEVIALVVVVIILMVTSTIALFLLHTFNLSLIHHDLQGLKVYLKDHSVKFVERVVILLLTIIIEWIFPFKESMLHPSLLLCWQIHLKFIWLMGGSLIQGVQIMLHQIWPTSHYNNNLQLVLKL